MGRPKAVLKRECGRGAVVARERGPEAACPAPRPSRLPLHE